MRCIRPRCRGGGNVETNVPETTTPMQEFAIRTNSEPNLICSFLAVATRLEAEARMLRDDDLGGFAK
jgi:hypothetical protein